MKVQTQCSHVNRHWTFGCACIVEGIPFPYCNHLIFARMHCLDFVCLFCLSNDNSLHYFMIFLDHMHQALSPQSMDYNETTFYSINHISWNIYDRAIISTLLNRKGLCTFKSVFRYGFYRCENIGIVTNILILCQLLTWQRLFFSSCTSVGSHFGNHHRVRSQQWLCCYGIIGLNVKDTWV